MTQFFKSVLVPGESNGCTHITQVCRDDGKCPSRSLQRIQGPIKAPSTNHSGKNACHFPTSGTDLGQSNV